MAGLVLMTSCNGPEEEGSNHGEENMPQLHRSYPVTLVIHGGAGDITRDNMTPALEKIYRSELRKALDQGFELLEQSGSSVEAVVTAIRSMEDSPWFNAGKGAVFTHEKTIEHDASLMDGRTGLAGAVAGVTKIKNPIVAAWKVMTRSPYVFLIARGAEAFARDQGLKLVDPAYFRTPRQLDRWRRLQYSKLSSDKGWEDDHGYLGTVGAVALDRFGNIAAGTSTGGTINKKYGRVGDSAVIGAGTYASNDTCGISATGHGEYFIRNVVAYDIASRMKYLGQSLEKASRVVIGERLKEIGGSGGVIGLDRNGHIVMEFNTPGMFRGYRQMKGEATVFIYGIRGK